MYWKERSKIDKGKQENGREKSVEDENKRENRD